MKRLLCPSGIVLEVEDDVAEGLLIKPDFSLAEDEKPKPRPARKAPAPDQDK